MVNLMEEVTSNRRVIPLIMCGGSGTRLWPASREGRPKQFIKLLGPHSTFQQTLLRLTDPLFDRPIIITNAAYRFMVQEQLEELGFDGDIVLEPARRDSGPALAAGAAVACLRESNAVVLALAADHVVKDTASFVASCRTSLAVAAMGHIATFGIIPDRPATEYGYILPGAPLAPDVMQVSQFVEKPDASTAAKYVQAGYLWNSGNFMFGADVLLEEYGQFDRASFNAINEAVGKAGRDLGFITLDKDAFQSARAISIDYAVMEKTTRAAVVQATFDWSDVGSWRAVWELSDKDNDGNAMNGSVFFEGARNCNVSTDGAVVALEGVSDLVVVVSRDAVLVSAQKDPNALKRLVGKLNKTVPAVTADHLKVHRPWGSYESLELGARHQVKRIVVKPGGQLSLQKHHHRSEHWIVVRGVALVTIDGAIRTVHENESVYVPIGAVHRMENPGKIPLELIEVQTGSYLGEDDIVRIEDVYQRA